MDGSELRSLGHAWYAKILLMHIRLKAKLGIGGPEMDPDVVERRLGVPATNRFRVGETTRGGHVRDAGGCVWETASESTRDSDPLVQSLLAPFRPLERVRQLADEMHGWIFVEVVGYVDGDVSPMNSSDYGFISPAYELSRQSVADLAILGSSYSVDQYIGIDERPDADRTDDERTDSWYWGDP